MANVVFHLDSKQEKAVRGFLEVVEAQKKADNQFGKTTRKARAQDRTLSQLARTAGKMTRMAGGFVGVGSIAGGVATFVRGMDKAVDKTVTLDRELTELFSLGDNVSNMDVIRKQVFDYSDAWGKASGDIASAMFNLQSGTANLSKTQQNQLMRSGLELNKFYGGELPNSMNALIKTYQIYRTEGESVTDVQRKLAKAAEDGFLTFEDMATQFPDIASAGKAVGTSLDELVSLLITATQRGGKTEKTFTGIRNVLLRLNNAEKEGVTLTGSLFDRLEQLQSVDPNTMKRIFGDEAIAVASNLVELTDDLRGNMESISNSLPDIGAKLDKKMADPVAGLASAITGLDQQAQNNAGKRATDLTTGNPQFVLRQKAAKAAFMDTQAGQFFGETAANAMGWVTAGLTSDTVKESFVGRNSGVVDMADNVMKKGGNPELMKQFFAAIDSGQFGSANFLSKAMPGVLPQTDPRSMLNARIAREADTLRRYGGELPDSLQSAAAADSAAGQYIVGNEVADATRGSSSSDLAAMLTELRGAVSEMAAAAKANAQASAASKEAADSLNGSTRKRRNAGGEAA